MTTANWWPTRCMCSFHRWQRLKRVCSFVVALLLVLLLVLLDAPTRYLWHSNKTCSGFLKTDALAVARHAELQTVDANQTVFSQGIKNPWFSLCSPRLYHFASFAKSIMTQSALERKNFRGSWAWVLFYPARICCDQDWQQSDQGSVLLRNLSAHTIINPTTHSDPWWQDSVRRACNAVQMQTLCLGWCEWCDP